MKLRVKENVDLKKYDFVDFGNLWEIEGDQWKRTTIVVLKESRELYIYNYYCVDFKLAKNGYRYEESEDEYYEEDFAEVDSIKDIDEFEEVPSTLVRMLLDGALEEIK